jgi:hypothetical protein
VRLLRRFRSDDRRMPPETASLPTGNNIVQVVGESNYQAALEQACNGANPAGPNRPGVIAHLVPEPDNPFDRNAVAVHVSGMTVGYLGRTDALAYQARLLELRAAGRDIACTARIKGGYAVPGMRRASFGIELFLAPADEL